jgi:Membrane protein putatively involved in post-translational modification of the autoinducing quorum-sensing peptide
MMKRLSEKLTQFVIDSGAISKESYAVYQYGFQIGLEMLSCLVVCSVIAVYLRMIPEFIALTVFFMLLRSFAGGVHLNSFWKCFICSVTVQTLVLVLNDLHRFSITNAWGIIILSSILIFMLSPVQSINKELDNDEKAYGKRAVMKILSGLLLFSGCCTLINNNKMVSLMAFIVLTILISQCVGVVKYKIEKDISVRK